MRILAFLILVLLLSSLLATPTPVGHSTVGDSLKLLSHWNIYTVDAESGVGGWSSIALDVNGYPHMSYYRGIVYDLKYANWTGNDWSIEAVDTDGAVGQCTSIALDGDGYPHISYFDNSNSDLKYANWNGTWNVETVDSAGAGDWTSLALDTAQRPHISYSGPTNELKYANWNGTAWIMEVVDPTDGSYTSIALNESDYPRISYFGVNTLRYASWDGGSWTIEVVDSGAYVVGMFTSLALDSSGNPHISYYDVSEENLKYARWTGTDWSTETVDSAGWVGWGTSIGVDSQDTPHIAYHDMTNESLKYARMTGGTWAIETIESAGKVGFTHSLAIDGNDYPYITHFNKTDKNLKLATKAVLELSGNPSLSSAPHLLDFGDHSPGETVTLSFEIWNSGNGTLDYMITENLLWTDVTPLNGSSIGEHDMINVTIDTTGLPEGLHTGTIHIASNGGNGTVNVSVNVLAPSSSLSLDIDPDTLNLKSNGRWITAYLSTNASVYDINVSSILLQDALAPERWDYQDDVLMLKFDRQDFKDTAQVGESVEVKISGKWEDGSEFEAYDHIRVIDSGKG